MLGVGHVLTWEGEGHTAYPQTTCITDAVDAYLIDLTVPAEPALTCPATLSGAGQVVGGRGRRLGCTRFGSPAIFG